MDTEKTEITKLPEGMSSEELDALTTGEESEDASLAKEALDATGESSPEKKPAEVAPESPPAEEEPTGKTEAKPAEADPKDAVIGEYRRKSRDLEIKNARMQGELEARKEIKAATTEAPKSPLEIAEADYFEQNGSMEGFAMNGELYRQQKAFDDKQAASKAATQKQEDANSALLGTAETLQEGELSVEKMGEGLDFQSIANIGDKHLTKGDKIDLADIQSRRGTAVALKEAYHIMVRRTLAAGGQEAKLLQIAITKSKTQAKPKEKTDIDALTTEGEDTNEGEAQPDTHSKRLADFIFSP